MLLKVRILLNCGADLFIKLFYEIFGLVTLMIVSDEILCYNFFSFSSFLLIFNYSLLCRRLSRKFARNRRTLYVLSQMVLKKNHSEHHHIVV